MSGAVVTLDPKLTTGRGQYKAFGVKFDFVLSRAQGAPDIHVKGEKPTYEVALVDTDGELIEGGGSAMRYVDPQTKQPRIFIRFSDRQFVRMIGQMEFSLTLWANKSPDGKEYTTTYKGTDRDEKN